MLTGLRSRLAGSFLGDVVKLSFGTLAGRVIALAALPLATRLYSPTDFALLAVYLSIVNTIAVAACLRLEIAIPLAEDDTDVANLLALALLSLSGVVTITLVLALLIPNRVAGWLGNPEITPYLWLAPLGIAFAGSYSALQFWTTRRRRFGSIARTRVSQAIAGVGTMLALGWAGIAPLGLLLGNMLNIGSGGFGLAALAWRKDRTKLRDIRLSALGDTFLRHRRYPLYSAPDALLNIAGVQVPVLIIAAQGGGEAGFLLLAMQIMTAPMTLLGGSISQVFMSRAPDEYRAGNLAPFTLSIMRRLVMVGVGPLILVGALAPIVFPWIFGFNWARAGEIVTWLVPWMALQFIASPVSMVMYVVGRQRAMLALTTFGSVTRIAAVIFANQYGLSIVEAFTMSSAAFYGICGITFVMAARHGNKDQPTQ